MDIPELNSAPKFRPITWHNATMPLTTDYAQNYASIIRSNLLFLDGSDSHPKKWSFRATDIATLRLSEGPFPGTSPPEVLDQGRTWRISWVGSFSALVDLPVRSTCSIIVF